MSCLGKQRLVKCQKKKNHNKHFCHQYYVYDHNTQSRDEKITKYFVIKCFNPNIYYKNVHPI